ncbi:prepilin peptidase (plasmid) [Paenibacillus rhizovicinus]|uniref:Prepilin peptidase n=1 Tax=Paenibacillus rhizovicinus TaxID=2704463 RepID=A0A6C0PA22_9BACL|nr:A24 family peptidase [Paenibacillus rhizovicinus]QHW35424.1 prepilin peptidase [Paenibacillus rhizovicinus]
MRPYFIFSFAVALGFWIGGYLRHLSPRIPLLCHPSSPLMARLAMATTIGLTVLFVDYSKEWLIAIPFAAALIMICFLDFRYKIIPDFITLPGILIVTALRSWIHPLPFLNYIIAAIVGAGIFYAIALMMQLSKGSNSIGGGDIKLLFLTGLVLGIKLSILAFALFCLAGMITGIIIVLSGKYRRDMLIPFGPFIACSTLVCYLWGSHFESWIIGKMLY